MCITHVCNWSEPYLCVRALLCVCVWTHALMYYLCRIIKGYLRTPYQLKLLFSAESYDSTSTIYQWTEAQWGRQCHIPSYCPAFGTRTAGSLQPAAPELPCGPALSAGCIILYMIISAVKSGFWPRLMPGPEDQRPLCRDVCNMKIKMQTNYTLYCGVSVRGEGIGTLLNWQN
jgi:hypothetical protein